MVDAHRNRKAVVLDYATWEELLALLEDYDSAREIRQLRAIEAVPWEQAKAQLRAEGPDV